MGTKHLAEHTLREASSPAGGAQFGDISPWAFFLEGSSSFWGTVGRWILVDLIYVPPNRRAGAVLSSDGNQVATDKHGEMVGDVSLAAHLLGPRAQFLGLRMLSCQFSGAQEGVVLTMTEGEGSRRRASLQLGLQLHGQPGLPPGLQQLLSIQSLKVQVVLGRSVLFVQVIKDLLVPEV